MGPKPSAKNNLKVLQNPVLLASCDNYVLLYDTVSHINDGESSSQSSSWWEIKEQKEQNHICKARLRHVLWKGLNFHAFRETLWAANVKTSCVLLSKGIDLLISLHKESAQELFDISVLFSLCFALFPVRMFRKFRAGTEKPGFSRLLRLQRELSLLIAYDGRRMMRAGFKMTRTQMWNVCGETIRHRKCVRKQFLSWEWKISLEERHNQHIHLTQASF